jgi:hypothetical protein
MTFSIWFAFTGKSVFFKKHLRREKTTVGPSPSILFVLVLFSTSLFPRRPFTPGVFGWLSHGWRCQPRSWCGGAMPTILHTVAAEPRFLTSPHLTLFLINEEHLRVLLPGERLVSSPQTIPRYMLRKSKKRVGPCWDNNASSLFKKSFGGRSFKHNSSINQKQQQRKQTRVGGYWERQQWKLLGVKSASVDHSPCLSSQSVLREPLKRQDKSTFYFSRGTQFYIGGPDETLSWTTKFIGGNYIPVTRILLLTLSSEQL